MAQQVNHLLHRLDNLNLTPGTHRKVGEENNSIMLYSDCHMYTVAYTLIIINTIFNNFFSNLLRKKKQFPLHVSHLWSQQDGAVLPGRMLMLAAALPCCASLSCCTSSLLEAQERASGLRKPGWPQLWVQEVGWGPSVLLRRHHKGYGGWQEAAKSQFFYVTAVWRSRVSQRLLRLLSCLVLTATG